MEIRRYQFVRLQTCATTESTNKKKTCIILSDPSCLARSPHNKPNTHVRVFGCIRRQGALVESFRVSNFRVSRGWIPQLPQLRVQSPFESLASPRFLLCPALSEKILQDQRARDSIDVNSEKKITSSVQQNDAKHDRAQHGMSSHDDFARQRTSNIHRANGRVGARNALIVYIFR